MYTKVITSRHKNSNANVWCEAMNWTARVFFRDFVIVSLATFFRPSLQYSNHVYLLRWHFRLENIVACPGNSCTRLSGTHSKWKYVWKKNIWIFIEKLGRPFDQCDLICGKCQYWPLARNSSRTEIERNYYSNLAAKTLCSTHSVCMRLILWV